MRRGGARAGRRAVRAGGPRLALATGLLTALAASGRAQEPAPFRVHGVEGYVSLRGLFEQDTSRFLGGPWRLRQTRPAFEQEVYLLVHSSIYHPNLLKLDFGGGPVFVQESFRSDGQSTSAPATLLNATARLTLLEKKPYPLALYYERRNPRVPLGLSERVSLRDTQYGFTFSLSQPTSPVPLRFEGYRQRILGSGFNQVVDEGLGHLSARAEPTLPWRGRASLGWQLDRRDSESGNPQLPIRRTRATLRTADLFTRNTFGSREQVLLMSTATVLSQPELPERQEIRMSPDLQWRPSGSLSLFSRYQFARGRVEGFQSRSHNATAGLRHQLYESLTTSAQAHRSSALIAGLQDDRQGAQADVSYRKKIPRGVLALYYGAAYDLFDRVSTAARVSVFGESLTLGLFPVELKNDNVIASTVVVFNATRSRTFREGIDYRLTVLGLKTRIQRLPTGDLREGEVVVVDYAFATTGTFRFSVLDRNYGGSVSLFSGLTLFARFRRAPQRLLEGAPTQPLDSVRGRLYGAELTAQVRGLRVSAQADFENQQAVILPFRRRALSASLNVPLASSLSLILSGRRALQDNLNSVEDVDLTGGTVRLEGQAGPRARLAAEGRYDRDLGGTVKRRDWLGSLQAEWRLRKLALRVEGQFRRERQDLFERTRATATVEIRREF